MEQTESKSIQIHAGDEQYYIDIMQKFHWNLKSSQEVNTKDSHVEARGDKVYSVTESQRYVKLVFTRSASFPNKDKFHALENEYFSIRYSENSSTKGGISMIIVGILVLCGTLCTKGGIGGSPFTWIGLLIIGAGIFLLVNTNKKNQEIADFNAGQRERIIEIINEATALHSEN